ncbi:MAG: hypothetical protein GY867_10055, partial [bacterium]|nr:hypothetical protein [bacterium]
LGDQLLALAPVGLSSPYTERYSDTMRLYYTNGLPTVVGLDVFTVTQPGVQQLVVSPNQPLILFDLDVSLEWDASYAPIYLDQLEYDLKKASQYLYDFSDGQVALGKLNVYQKADNWGYSHLVIHANNNFRPYAYVNGAVMTETVDLDQPLIIYDTGQLHMGSTWNRYGRPGQSIGDDWPLILAHELSHYLFGMLDVYLGFTEDDFLVTVGSCSGSAMGDVYNPNNTEFIFNDAYWQNQAICGDTLPEQVLTRDEWATIRTWYPWLQEPAQTLSGPGRIPYELTEVTTHD